MSLLNFISKILNRFIGDIVHVLALPLVRIMEWFRKTFHIKTYRVENAFVFLILVTVLIVTDNIFNVWKWIELFAVYFTFQHVSISQRLEERQHKEFTESGVAKVDCYYKLPRYLVGKEVLWLVTFIYLHAWAALAGVLILLTYYPWRAMWRKYHPIR